MPLGENQLKAEDIHSTRPWQKSSDSDLAPLPSTFNPGNSPSPSKTEEFVAAAFLAPALVSEYVIEAKHTSEHQSHPGHEKQVQRGQQLPTTGEIETVEQEGDVGEREREGEMGTEGGGGGELEMERERERERGAVEDGEGEGEDRVQMMEFINSLQQSGDAEMEDETECQVAVSPNVPSVHLDREYSAEQNNEGTPDAGTEQQLGVIGEETIDSDTHNGQMNATSSPLSDLPDLPDTLQLTPPRPVISPPPFQPFQSFPNPNLPRSVQRQRSPSPLELSLGRKRSRVFERESSHIIDSGYVGGDDEGERDKKKVRGGRNQRGRIDPTGTGRKVKGPEKVTARGKVMSETQIRKLLLGKALEFQLAPCQRPRYAKWGKCTQCISKLGGDSCRFRDYRVFPIDPQTTEITGAGYFLSTTWPQTLTPLPTRFNTYLTSSHINTIESTVAPILLPLITSESRHVFSHPDIIQRGVDSAKHRSVCDFCSSTIFGGWWFCKKCGRDYCLQCERYFPDDMSRIKESPWELSDAARPRLLKCNYQSTPNPRASGTDSDGVRKRRDKELAWHVRGDLQPVSRFAKDELKEHWLDLSDFVLGDLAGAVLSSDKMIWKDDFWQEDVRIMGLEGDEEVDKILLDWRAKVLEKDVEPDVGRQTSPEKIVKGEGKATPDEGEKYSPKSAAQLVMELSDEEDKLPPPPSPLKVHRPHIPTRTLLRPKQNTELAYLSPPLELAEYYNLTKTTIVGPGSPPGYADPVDPASLDSHSLPFLFIPTTTLYPTSSDHSSSTSPNDIFSSLWSLGQPLITGDLRSRMRTEWTPEKFIEKFGNETCSIVDCQTDEPRDGRVGDFFEMFGKDEGERRGKGIFKLKDWPHGDDFKNSHPELYDDFCRALPVPDYTRRDGVLNLYSHFPPGPTRPDIGPKMYAAFAANELPGGFGSTRLHMDVADAINIMLFASPSSQTTSPPNSSPPGASTSPGCAVWDLYPAKDADKIREFLKEKFDKTHSFIDPIHSQMFYLDSRLRKQLYEKKGVVGWRVYQYPGQAVFIPAGCAHQVCNLADCIKVALDFVSPHNVPRCQQLTRDFRRENYLKAWKEDVLQLYNVLWYAWISCRQTRGRRERDSTVSTYGPHHVESNLYSHPHPHSHTSSLSYPPFSRDHDHRPSPPPSRSASGSGPGPGLLGTSGYGSMSLGGVWGNVSSVRDEPRGSPIRPSPTVTTNLAFELAKEHVEPIHGNNKESQRVGDTHGTENIPEAKQFCGMKDTRVTKSQRSLAESLFTLTLKREETSPNEIFLPSTALSAGRRKPVLPKVSTASTSQVSVSPSPALTRHLGNSQRSANEDDGNGSGGAEAVAARGSDVDDVVGEGGDIELDEEGRKAIRSIQAWSQAKGGDAVDVDLFGNGG